jgi:hypothetical protein
VVLPMLHLASASGGDEGDGDGDDSNIDSSSVSKWLLLHWDNRWRWVPSSALVTGHLSKRLP